MNKKKIILKKVKVHNLKSVDLELPTNELIVFTGVSGSGKSSMAFDTLYMEGQRRYVESLSLFARRQMGDMAKPDLESAEGISPTISIEQKTAGKNPRSTVGTMTEIYDYLRVLFARIAIPYCPVSKEPVLPQSRERIIKTLQTLPEGTKIVILTPFAKGKKGEFKEDFADFLRKGFTKARVDGNIINLEDDVSLDRNSAHDIDIVVDRITVKESEYSRIAESATQALILGEGVCSYIDADTKNEVLFSQYAYSPKSGLSYPSLEPHDFSFNSPQGMCPECHGLGYVKKFNLEKVIEEDKSISEDCCLIASSYETVRFGNIYDNLARIYRFSVDTPWKNLPKSAQNVFLYGTEKKWTKMVFTHPVTLSTWIDHVNWRGVLHEALTRYNDAKSDSYKSRMEAFMEEGVCPYCEGEKLKPYPRAAKFQGKRISEINQLTIGEASRFFDHVELSPQEFKIAEELLKEIRERLHFLNDVGLHYLTLDRTSPTLSGGEAQRVRLASQIGSGLVGITYILDEPSIGLHPRDNKKLIRTLKHLRDMGNTVIVVEHDDETIFSGDRVVDFGPGPGIHGGEIVSNGSLKNLLTNPLSKTGGYLSGRLSIPMPRKKRKPSAKEFIEIQGAAHHNLKNINVKIPLGLFVAVTGVSGSGKSSLISDILFPALDNALHGAELKVGSHKGITGIDKIDKVITIDQSPIGRNPRSNPSTYIKLFDEIRNLFSQLPESAARGFKPGRFSFNVKEGSCSACQGMGMIKVDMDFMEDAWIDCSQCLGRRFDPETLSIYFKGKNIHDILEMSVEEAYNLFESITPIKKKLETLKQVGLDYIKLGQSSTTLSGGEAQRVKLAKELSRPSTGKTLYILDEPTTGLHYHDIKHLLEVLQNLVARGNSVVVIEHNMDVVKVADWIIDLGPEGGEEGGRLVAEGPPEKLIGLDSPTGSAIREALTIPYEEKSKLYLKEKKKEASIKAVKEITVENAEQNNLKGIDAVIPREKVTVLTGPSGSGKSSLAFETIYAEGQRRYIESMSPYTRQFVKQMPKPKVGRVEGLSPAIAIEQKAHAGNPRSTVGTMTEIYDYLRLLFARKGIPHDPETGEVIQEISKEYVLNQVMNWETGEKLIVLAPIDMKKGDSFDELKGRLSRQGYLRIRLNNEYFELDSEIPFDRKRKNEIYLVIDRLVLNENVQSRLFDAIENAAAIGKGKLAFAYREKDVFFNLSFTAKSSGRSFQEITPHTFAFNKAEGMCLDCQGLGYQYGASLQSKADLLDLPVLTLARILWEKPDPKLTKFFLSLLKAHGIDPKAPLKDLSESELHFILNGSQDVIAHEGIDFKWIGFNNALGRAGKKGRSEVKEGILPLLEERVCEGCRGARINPLARHVTINGISIADVSNMPIEEAIGFIESLPLDSSNKLLLELQENILARLSFLKDVGLHYIQLSRSAPTLSGGESQRIRLARQLGSGLTGVLYVLDEPTIGLHPRDNEKLNNALEKLKNLGNTLLLVEHDPLTVQSADHIVDFGPHAGLHGGHIMSEGTVKQILKDPKSLTGAYLSGKKSIPLPKKRRALNFGLSIENAKENNLKDISLHIPLSALTVFTGVSGSGKSTLLHQVLLPAVKKGLLKTNEIELASGKVSGISHFERLIVIDQNPIGQTIRSDVCTYADILTPLRDFFSQLPAARAKGLQPKHFSYNHRRGMCTSCWGLGFKKVEMHFLPPIKVPCEDCKGLRLNPLSLEIQYDKKNLGQYLQSTVLEARQAFANFPRIVRVLDTLISVGLGYLKLGQEIASLSGGEAQRIKLSRELSKRSHGKTLYLLDEPTVGLHPDDILKLSQVLNKLIDKGNTMIVIEHNLDIIKLADYIIDLGPEAGKDGGTIVAKGRPEDIVEVKSSWTGQFLKPLLESK